MTKPGTRVIAIRNGEAGVIYYYGEGVYTGDFPKEDSLFPEIPNPRIDLDSGKVVWGCECWWGPAEYLRSKYPEPAFTWELVDIDADRAAHAAAKAARSSE